MNEQEIKATLKTYSRKLSGASGNAFSIRLQYRSPSIELNGPTHLAANARGKKPSNAEH
jgi:hypothetical protein